MLRVASCEGRAGGGIVEALEKVICKYGDSKAIVVLNNAVPGARSLFWSFAAKLEAEKIQS